MVGYELDYSHKIGRLMAYAWFTIVHGTAMPFLYILFFIHLLSFYMIEKWLMLKFYRKMDLQAAWIRDFLIHTLFLIVIWH